MVLSGLYYICFSAGFTPLYNPRRYGISVCSIHLIYYSTEHTKHCVPVCTVCTQLYGTVHFLIYILQYLTFLQHYSLTRNSR
jgi:hypothetical protein